MKKNSLLIPLILIAASVMASLAYAGPDHKRELAEIRRATAKYQDLDAALAAGYEILFDCTVLLRSTRLGLVAQSGWGFRRLERSRKLPLTDSSLIRHLLAPPNEQMPCGAGRPGQASRGEGVVGICTVVFRLA